jgi:hypothetical protein
MFARRPPSCGRLSFSSGHAPKASQPAGIVDLGLRTEFNFEGKECFFEGHSMRLFPGCAVQSSWGLLVSMGLASSLWAQAATVAEWARATEDERAIKIETDKIGLRILAEPTVAVRAD